MLEIIKPCDIPLNGKLYNILRAFASIGFNWTRYAQAGLKNIDVSVVITNGTFDHRVSKPTNRFLSDHHTDTILLNESVLERHCPVDGDLIIASL